MAGLDTVDLRPLLERLDDKIDDLEESLEPLLKTALSESAARLPIVDKAKLYVLTTYAIESILFSYLRLNGVNAKEHAVFRELTRVKQYFEKIKRVEAGEVKRENLSLDKQAAGRFIKHALAGNDKYDLERAEQQAKERARSHIRFEQTSTKRKADETEGLAREPEDSSSSSSSDESESNGDASPTGDAEDATAERPSKKQRNSSSIGGNISQTGSSGSGKYRKKRHAGEKKRQLRTADTKSEETSEAIVPSSSKPNPSHDPLSHSAAFQALLNGPLPKRDNSKNQKLSKKEKRAAK
ncbi:MAG: hypothetical protein M1819_003677 [Sarea resinae]|nr:MAG: hypothetical protein M1819_003677 [Sarea resinae]